MPIARRLARVLAVPETRDARVFAVAAVVDALGNGLFLPITALFFVKVVGLPVTRVGLGLSITGVVGLAGPILGGPLIDRYGPRRVGVALMWLRALTFASYPLVRGFLPFVLLASATNLMDTMARPAMQALMATLADEKDRVTTLAFVRSVRNIGYGVGGLLVSAALALGGKGPYVGLVLGDAVTFAVAGVVLTRVRDTRAPRVPGPATGYAVVLRDRRFLALGALHGVLSLNLSILLFGFPLWIDQRTNAPTWVAGTIFAVNSALVVLLQVPFSRRAVTVADGGRALRHCGFALLVTCVLLALTPGLPALAAAVLLVLIGVVECGAEIWHAAGGWAISLGLAPPEARGRYLGVWQLGFAVHDIGGPAIIGFVVARGGRVSWLVLGVVLAVTGVAVSALAASAPGTTSAVPEVAEPAGDVA